MLEQSVVIDADEIKIFAQFFVHKDFSITFQETLLDILGKHYRGQKIRVVCWDGENLDFSNFYNFLKKICEIFDIAQDQVTIESHDPDQDNGFNNHVIKLGIFKSVNSYLPSIQKDLSRAKFVGCLLARYNITRLRLAYELDTAFTNDTYITYQPKVNFVKDTLKHFESLYADELAWLDNKQFDQDLLSRHYMGMIGWKESSANYDRVWNCYQIEVVSETDSMSDFWFTEKTANCLATGKPFVLMAGTNSLARLRDMGFKTFDNIIDETYDRAKHPYERIRRLTNSLKDLYNSSNRREQISKLYTIAEQNIQLYQNYNFG